MPIKTLIEAIRDAIDVEMARDPRVFVLGEDVGVKGGVFLATDGLYQKYGMKRAGAIALAAGAVALAVRRGAIRAPPGSEGRYPGDGLRCQRPAHCGHPRSRPGRFPGAQEGLSPH